MLYTSKMLSDFHKLKYINITNFWSQGVFPIATDKPKNSTIYWQGTDTEENFKDNPVEGYTETSITYIFNSNGFREQEFNLTNTRPKILCLGCSHTEGIGLRLEDAWVTKLKKYFPNHDVYNLGWGGSSADTVARLLTNCASLFKPDAVFVLWPDQTRYEMYNYPRNIVFKGPWNMEKSEVDYFDIVQLRNNLIKNKLIAELLAEKYKFKLVELSSDELNLDDDFKMLYTINKSRDGHYSITQHDDILKRFMERFNAS